MANIIVPYSEALRFLRDWSAILLLLQTLIFVALVFICVFDKNRELRKGLLCLISSLTFWAFSIVIALNVIGTIPWSAQHLPELVDKYHNIYDFPNYIGIPIWILASVQHICFLFGMIFS